MTSVCSCDRVDSGQRAPVHEKAPSGDATIPLECVPFPCLQMILIPWTPALLLREAVSSILRLLTPTELQVLEPTCPAQPQPCCWVPGRLRDSATSHAECYRHNLGAQGPPVAHGKEVASWPSCLTTKASCPRAAAGFEAHALLCSALLCPARCPHGH